MIRNMTANSIHKLVKLAHGKRSTFHCTSNELAKRIGIEHDFCKMERRLLAEFRIPNSIKQCTLKRLPDRYHRPTRGRLINHC